MPDRRLLRRGIRDLLAANPELARTLRVRDDLARALPLTVNGIAAGLRNTG